ncbi:hypothetical protein C7974DRAFT_418193 [Boeremia exigua]|uniref:uncharacterized protein n=1 Tax=Boeremia exigua TaxID=749465 RepID=UPI001E8DCDB4|nr:uncharacterized protein C7974DRAFT_418193 [Boeremia exigua]KAH6613102.1 hypothetical protein C7974DRAFT_418193 [Boeremia exigua]
MPCTFVSSLLLRAALEDLNLNPEERATTISSIEHITYIESLDEDTDEEYHDSAPASPSNLFSPIEGDSTTPPTSASIVSPLSPAFPAPVRTKRNASGSLDDSPEDKVPRLRGGAGGPDHHNRLVRVVYDHKSSVDENGLPDRINLPGEVIRPDGGAPVPANRDAAAAANAVYDLAEKALQGFRVVFDHTQHDEQSCSNWKIGEGLLFPKHKYAPCCRDFEFPGKAYKYNPDEPDIEPLNTSGNTTRGTKKYAKKGTPTSNVNDTSLYSKVDKTVGDYNKVQPGDDRYVKSLVMSHAFYLFTKASQKPSWELSGKVWWNALAALNENEHKYITIKMWSEITLVAAADAFGDDIVQQLRSAWAAVNVLF